MILYHRIKHFFIPGDRHYRRETDVIEGDRDYTRGDGHYKKGGQTLYKLVGGIYTVQGRGRRRWTIYMWKHYYSGCKIESV